MDPCQLVITDLKKNKGWSAAARYRLGAKDVVVARECLSFPLVVFVPFTQFVNPVELNHHIDRARQLSLDICSKTVDIDSVLKESDDYLLKSDNLPRHHHPSSDLTSPDIFQPVRSTSRFRKDRTFSRDKCQDLHNQIELLRSEFEMNKKEASRKRIHVEEIRLGLNPSDDSGCDKENDPAEEEYSQFKDFHLSVIFAFLDGSVIAYYQGAHGLAPPPTCPDDSDDEKPLEVVKNDMKRLQKKQSQRMEN